MYVTEAEFKNNSENYLQQIDQLKDEDIFNTEVSAVDAIRGIIASAPSDIDAKSIREEKLKKY